MSDFEENAFLAGYDDNQEYLNYLSNNEDGVSYYDNDEEIRFPKKRKEKELSIFNEAKNILYHFYWEFEQKPYRLIYEYKNINFNNVEFINEHEYELIDILYSLDFEAENLIKNIKIKITIDSCYDCLATITATLTK